MFYKKALITLGVLSSIFSMANTFAGQIYLVSNETINDITVTYPKLLVKGTIVIPKVNKQGRIKTAPLTDAVPKSGPSFTIMESKSLVCVYKIIDSGFEIIQNASADYKCVKKSPTELSVNISDANS